MRTTSFRNIRPSSSLVFAIALALLVVGSVAFAQTSGGAIAGTVTDPGGIVAGATVQAREQSTAKVYTAISGKAGQFRVGGLPAGTYEISVPPLGFRTQPYKRENVAVDGGKTSALDIMLSLGNLGVVGDDNAYLAIRAKSGSITGRTPRMADGKPDLSGVWNANVPSSPEAPALLPWAAAVMKEREANFFRDSPGALCLPSDSIPSWPLLYKIVQTPSLFVQLFEHEPHYRQAFLDGRGHPSDLDSTWMGHSIGKWQKDVLIIDTVGLNNKTWITVDNLPHTTTLHTTERYRRPDLAHLLVDITIDDPGTFLKPMELHMTWELAQGEEIQESICNENNKFERNAGIR
jgi:hypothetical protein